MMLWEGANDENEDWLGEWDWIGLETKYELFDRHTIALDYTKWCDVRGMIKMEKIVIWDEKVVG